MPKGRSLEEMSEKIPITYVPARNTIFLSFALAWAEVLGSSNIFLGVNALDYSGYPDCRPEFVAAFEQLANLATKAGVEGQQKLKIHTPLISLSKAEIIRKGMELGVDYRLTSSCYDPSAGGVPCGACDSCLLRQKGFRENGLADPLRYKKDPGPLHPSGWSVHDSDSSMNYAVKEIFYTLQGEGAQAGRAAVFCRFAGCNLWSGREEDRAAAICRFCDTNFVGADGPDGGRFNDASALADRIAKTWQAGSAPGSRDSDSSCLPAESPCCKWTSH